MADKLVFAWRDYDGDRKQVSYEVTEAGDLNAEWTAIKAELDKWTAGADAGGGYFEELGTDSGNSASSPIAQSLSQAIVEYRDVTTGRTYIHRIPFPDLSKANDAQTPPQPAFAVSGGVTVFNPDHTDYPLLVSALENALISPAGNFIQVNRIYIEE